MRRGCVVKAYEGLCCVIERWVVTCVVKVGEVVGLCSEGVVKGWSRISQGWSRVGQFTKGMRRVY